MTATDIQSIGADYWNAGFEEGLAKGKEIGKDEAIAKEEPEILRKQFIKELKIQLKIARSNGKPSYKNVEDAKELYVPLSAVAAAYNKVIM